MISVNQRYCEVVRQVADAAKRANRRPEDIGLIAVTKKVPIEGIRAVVLEGATMLGESRVQEARQKQALLGDDKVQWHLIGHLQTNKAKQAVETFSLIHSVDRYALAEALNEAALRIGKVQEILVQVNVSGEASKSGFAPCEVLAAIDQMTRLEAIAIKGLMTIAPLVEPEATRPVFRGLRELFEEAKRIPGAEMRHLSMGMSNDFPVAIEEGATLLRIGTAIFGKTQLTMEETE